MCVGWAYMEVLTLNIFFFCVDWLSDNNPRFTEYSICAIKHLLARWLFFHQLRIYVVWCCNRERRFVGLKLKSNTFHCANANDNFMPVTSCRRYFSTAHTHRFSHMSYWAKFVLGACEKIAPKHDMVASQKSDLMAQLFVRSPYIFIPGVWLEAKSPQKKCVSVCVFVCFWGIWTFYELWSLCERKYMKLQKGLFFMLRLWRKTEKMRVDCFGCMWDNINLFGDEKLKSEIKH